MSGSGRWARDWLVQFRVTSHQWSRRLFASGDAAHAFAERVRQAGGHATVTDLASLRKKAGTP